MAQPIVIVGAGECGVRAASAIREAGHDGPVTLIGEERHAPYERPPLSKAAITDEAPPAPKTIRTAEALAEAGIHFIADRRVVRIERAQKMVALGDGGTVAYDKLLLATGALPRRLPLPGADGPRTRYLRTFEDSVAIRAELTPGRRITIIGGGFIGLEVAASACQRGAAVTVIEALPRILSRGVTPEIADVVAARHAVAGVTISTGDGIASIEQTAADVTVTLASGRTIVADLLIIGIGCVPAAHLADACGLEIQNGIAVDETLQTSDPDIFAAGDCCSFPLPIYGGRRVRLESWRSAQEQGNLAARNLLGRREAVSAIPWVWSDQYDLTLQVAGLIDEGRSQVRRELGDGTFILFHIADDGRLVAASGIGKGNAVARDIRLAEMLIAKRAKPTVQQLASPDVKLKALLAATASEAA